MVRSTSGETSSDGLVMLGAADCAALSVVPDDIDVLASASNLQLKISTRLMAMVV